MTLKYLNQNKPKVKLGENQNNNNQNKSPKKYMYNKMSAVTKTLIIITGAHHEVESRTEARI